MGKVNPRMISRYAKRTGQTANVAKEYKENGAGAAAKEAAKSTAENIVFDALSGGSPTKQKAPASQTPSPKTKTATPAPKTKTAAPSANKGKPSNTPQNKSTRDMVEKRNEHDQRRAQAEQQKKQRQNPANHNKNPNSPYRKGETPAPKTKAPAPKVTAPAKTMLKEGEKTAVKSGEKVLAKTGGKALVKSGIKKVPGVSLIAGAYYAGGRFAEGDYAGCTLELLSGLAGCVPVVGTWVSAGLDVTLAARDVSRAMGKDEPHVTLTKEQEEELDRYLAQMSPKERAEFDAQCKAAWERAAKDMAQRKLEGLQQYQQPSLTPFEARLMEQNQSAQSQTPSTAGLTAQQLKGEGERKNKTQAGQNKTTGASTRNASTRTQTSQQSRGGGRG